MFRVFEAETADQAWQLVASQFREGRGVVPQASRAGYTHEILRAAICVTDPRQRWVISRYPPINPSFAIAEVVWIMTGRNDSAFVNYFNRELPRYAGAGPKYHGAYGYRLRRHWGVDQLDRAYRALRAKPYSRQVVLQLWDVKADFPGPNGEEADTDIPCNIMSMLKLRGDALEWVQILRSNDIYRGLPYNFVQFTMMQEVVAGWLGVSVGTHNILSDSLHVYEDSLGTVMESIPVDAPPSTDSIALPKEQSDEAFQELEHQVSRVIDENVTADELVAHARGLGLAQGFRNMLCLLCAEGVRRRGRNDLIEKVMSDCTNALYRQLYERWLARVSSKKRPATVFECEE